MNLIEINQISIFDGAIDRASATAPLVCLDGHQVAVDLSTLRPIDDLTNNNVPVKPTEISKALNFKTSDFDGNTVFHGSRQGLKLYYKIIVRGENDVLLVFSFGELQPERFVCRYEAAFLLN